MIEKNDIERSSCVGRDSSETMTLGEFRRITGPLDDDTLIIVSKENGIARLKLAAPVCSLVVSMPE